MIRRTAEKATSRLRCTVCAFRLLKRIVVAAIVCNIHFAMSWLSPFVLYRSRAPCFQTHSHGYSVLEKHNAPTKHLDHIALSAGPTPSHDRPTPRQAYPIPVPPPAQLIPTAPLPSSSQPLSFAQPAQQPRGVRPTSLGLVWGHPDIRRK
jgi:hypothetical protein